MFSSHLVPDLFHNFATVKSIKNRYGKLNQRFPVNAFVAFHPTLRCLSGIACLLRLYTLALPRQEQSSQTITRTRGTGPCLTEKPSMVVYEMKARQQLLQASATVPLDDDEPVIEQW